MFVIIERLHVFYITTVKVTFLEFYFKVKTVFQHPEKQSDAGTREEKSSLEQLGKHWETNKINSTDLKKNKKQLAGLQQTGKQTNKQANKYR